VVSDIHLGNRRNPAEDIIANLDRQFPDNAETAQLDLIVLAGDVFDKLLSSNDVVVIDLWIARFLRLCKKHDIALRVLEGTPSHDWKQSDRFTTINNGVANIGADLVYVKDLSIRYEEKFDMNFLFVPDEWSSSSEKTLSQVKDIMQAKRLAQVDYAFMHGQFEFQLPKHIKAQKHDSAEYLKLVKHLIFIGHVHTYRFYDRIYAQGSFDRIAHNEEEPKGHLRVKAFSDGRYDIVFHETVHAKKFVTVDCLDLPYEDAVRKVVDVGLTLPSGSWLRVYARNKAAIFSNFDEVKRQLIGLHLERKEEDADAIEELENIEDSDYVPITITKDNIEDLLMERIRSKVADPSIVTMSEILLREVVHE